MMGVMSDWDYPWSAFRSAINSTFGRMASFILACFLGLFLAAWLLQGDTVIGWGLLPGLPIAFVFQEIVGVVQGWGLIADALLLALLSIYLCREARPSFTLPAVVLVVSMEQLRQMPSMEGFSRFPWADDFSVPERRVVVFLVAWTSALGVLAVHFVYSRLRSRQIPFLEHSRTR